MTSVPVNDENRGVCPGKKLTETDTHSGLFDLDQPTGRPSILRLSQAENLPNKPVVKGVKVCFQTPRRDPVTKRIVSPTKSLKMASLDECTKALEAMVLTAPKMALPQENEPVDGLTSDFTHTFPAEEVPIQSKGDYQLDFDNLDAVNPFQASVKMTLSPRPCESVEEPMSAEQNEPDACDSVPPEETSDEPAAALDETLPFIPSVENSLADISTDMHSTDSSVITMATKAQDVSNSEEEQSSLSLDQDQLTNLPAFDDASLPIQGSQPEMKSNPAVSPPPSKPPAESVSALEECSVKLPGLDEDQALNNSSAFDDTPLLTKGSYNFDNLDLDSVNPFQTNGSKMQNSPVLGKKLPCDFVEVSQPVQETPTLPEMKPEPSVSPTSKSPAEEVPVKLPGLDKDQALNNSSAFDDTPLLTKGSYNFDNLDSVNPFQTNGSKMQNSPVLGKKLPCDIVEVSQPVQETPTLPEMKPEPSVSPTPSKPSDKSMSPVCAPPKEGSVKLDFNFDDGGEVKRKPPKKFGKRPLGVKKAEKKAEPDVNTTPKSPPVKPVAETGTDVVSKGAYSFDFEKFDDPNFNPFGSNVKTSDSPKCSLKSSPKAVKSSPQGKAADTEKQVASTKEMIEPVQHETASSTHAVPSGNSQSADVTLSQQPQAGTINYPGSTIEKPLLSTPELGQLEENAESLLSEDNFVPGATFIANDFDDQMDYLEQFGSSTFKESALRKQSLYLKFDPLLRESPKKAGGAAVLSAPRPSAFASRLETQRTGAKENTCEPTMGHFDFLDVPAPVVNHLVQSRPMLEVTPFPQPVNSEDAIFDVLKYSQKDLDAAIATVETVAKKKEDQWEAKYEALSQERNEMRKICGAFEDTVAQISEERQKEKEAAQAALVKAQQEKEQASGDLNALERSFSDVWKRLDKYKEVVEGYKKNEEMLKKCAQDYLARIKKEEQRYQALKAHAEEKIGLANAQISEVRSRQKAEMSTLQVQLRREQMKVQSLEQNLEQKVKENADLTNLCDELITKVQS